MFLKPLAIFLEGTLESLFDVNALNEGEEYNSKKCTEFKLQGSSNLSVKIHTSIRIELGERCFVRAVGLFNTQVFYEG